jgi:hypothetical protein
MLALVPLDGGVPDEAGEDRVQLVSGAARPEREDVRALRRRASVLLKGGIAVDASGFAVGFFAMIFLTFQASEPPAAAGSR